MLRRAMTLVLAILIAILAAGQTASAQANNAAPRSGSQVNSGNGLRISPVRNDLTIKPGESADVDVYIQNVTNSPARLKGVINDFVASDDESGQPRPLLDDNSRAPSHGLKDYVSPIADFTLQPQEQKIIKVRVSIPASAAGGGYFGIVRFLPEGVDSSQNVSLAASVGSLFLVTVPGDYKEQASVASFNIQREGGKASNFFTNGSKDGAGKALQAVVRVQNNGDVQVAPFGKMTLKKSGTVLATYELNNTTPRGSVLPDSVRRFTVDLGDKTSSIGKYTLEGNFGYGSSGQLIQASTTFYVVPLPFLIAGVILLVALIGGLVIFPRMMRVHDRKLMRRLRARK